MSNIAPEKSEPIFRVIITVDDSGIHTEWDGAFSIRLRWILAFLGAALASALGSWLYRLLSLAP